MMQMLPKTDVRERAWAHAVPRQSPAMEREQLCVGTEGSSHATRLDNSSVVCEAMDARSFVVALQFSASRSTRTPESRRQCLRTGRGFCQNTQQLRGDHTALGQLGRPEAADLEQNVAQLLPRSRQSSSRGGGAPFQTITNNH